MPLSFNYTENPAAFTRDAVRFLTGDTDENDVLLGDQEIDWLLSQSGDEPYQAAIEGCRVIAKKLLRRPDFTAGRITISNKDRAKGFMDLAEDLRRQRLLRVAPFAGGISKSDKDSRIADPDRVEPFFTRKTAVPSGQQNPPLVETLLDE